VRQLETLCRERGLIPQSQKFEILQTKSVKDALGSLPSLGDPDEERLEKLFGMSVSKAERTFDASLDKLRPRHIADKSRAKYVLFRGPPSGKIRRQVLKLLPRHPEYIDAFIFYLKNFRRSPKLIEICSNCAIKTPFDYVAGEMLNFLANKVKRPEARALLTLALRIAGDKQAGISAKCGALTFLCKCEELDLGRYSRFVYYQPGFVQALVMKVLPPSALTDPRAASMAHGESIEAGLAYVSRLIGDGIPLAHAGVDPMRCKSQIRHMLAALGVSPRLGMMADPVSEVIHRRYRCGSELVWRALFDQEYGHAVQQLTRAEALFDMGRSEWLNYQDSFNHALFLALQRHLNRLSLPGACKTINSAGHLVKYGLMLTAPHPFAVAQPNIAAAFDGCHRRRNKLPSSHPYDEKTQTRTKTLTKKEQTNLVSNLKAAYRQVVRVCMVNSIIN
jgi:hypothetical protein